MSTVLIIGDNKKNDIVSAYFKERNYRSVIIEDISDLRSVDGQEGYFTAKTKCEDIGAEFVILTQQPEAKQIITGGLETFSVYDDACKVLKSKSSKDEPIAFLLDFVAESPAAATVEALKQAAKLALGKHPVYYFSKFVRTASAGAEKLYRAARQAGVTFVKYETLCLEGDEDTGKFTINASDGVCEIQIQSKAVFADGSIDTGGDFASAVKKLKLSVDENGNIAEDKYYLGSAHTGRRGVYYISRDIFALNLEKTLKHITAYQLSNIWEESSTPVVDGEKCVLCLNCIRVCTHAALTPDNEARQMRVLQYACEGCGSCASICPGAAITFEEETSFVPKDKSNKILALCCENSAAAAIEKVLPMLGEKSSLFEVISIPCGGRINSECIIDNLSSYSKVLSAVCMDDACRHFSGEKRACKQTELVKKRLETAGILPDSVHFIRTSHVMPGVLCDELVGLIEG